MKSILIIDDNPEYRETLQELLSVIDGEEVRVVQAQDGFDGLLKIKNEKFNVIICDNHMPKKTGLDLIEDLITTHKMPTNRFILVSGSLTKPEVELVIKLKIKTVLTKPVDFNRLLEKVKLSLTSDIP